MTRRLPHLLTAICFLFLFFGWGTRGTPSLFFTAFWPQMHLLYGFAFLTCLLLFLRFYPAVTRIFEHTVAWRYRLFPPLAGITAALIAFFVFDGIPHVIDAAHFEWTARLILRGKLSIPANDLYEFQDTTFMVRDGGRFYSLFLPGLSLFLAPFTAAGIGWIFTPLCTALSVFFAGKIADYFFDERTSFLAMALATFSSFFLFMGASFMTHAFNLMAVMLAVWFATCTDRRPLYLFLSSTALATTLFIRPQNALFAFIPLALFLLVKRTPLRFLALFAVPMAVTGGGVLLYNMVMTGSPLVFPQDIYFSVIEPRPFCHRLGLGTGCPNTEGEYLPSEGLTFEYAFWVAYTRLTLTLFNVTGHPYPFLFLSLACLFALRRTLFLSSFFLVFFAGYYFFYLPGNLFGPRYFTEIMMLLLIPAAYGIVETCRRLPPVLRSFIAAFPCSGVLFVSFFIMPELVERYSDRFWATDRSFEEAISKKGIRNSVVFVPETYHSMFLNTQKNPPYDNYGNLILRSLGRENYYSAAYYMETQGLRNAYVIDYYPRLRNLTVVEELPDFRLNDIWIELEHKGRPLTGKPSYVTPVVVGKKVRYLPFDSLDEDLDFSNDKGLAILFGMLDEMSYYDFTVPILDPGDYEVTLEYLALPCGGSFSLAVNNHAVLSFSAYGKTEAFVTQKVIVPLNAGANRFVITPAAGQSCLILDYLRLKKRDVLSLFDDYPEYAPPEEKDLNR